MPLKRYRISINFDVDVHEINQKTIRKSIERYHFDEPEKSELERRVVAQKALLNLFLTNPELMRRFLAHRAVESLTDELIDMIMESLQVDRNLEPILQSALKEIPEEQKGYFKNAIQEETAFEHLFELMSAVNIKFDGNYSGVKEGWGEGRAGKGID